MFILPRNVHIKSSNKLRIFKDRFNAIKMILLPRELDDYVCPFKNRLITFWPTSFFILQVGKEHILACFIQIKEVEIYLTEQRVDKPQFSTARYIDRKTFEFN